MSDSRRSPTTAPPSGGKGPASRTRSAHGSRSRNRTPKADSAAGAKTRRAPRGADKGSKDTGKQPGAATGTDEALRAPYTAQEIDVTGLGTPSRRGGSDAGGPAPRHGQQPRPPTVPEAHDGRADDEHQHLPRLPTGPEAQDGRAGETGEPVTEPSAVVGVHFADADAATAEDFPVPVGTESSESDHDTDGSAEDAVDGAVRSFKDSDTDKAAEAGPRFDRLLGSHPAGLDAPAVPPSGRFWAFAPHAMLHPGHPATGVAHGLHGPGSMPAGPVPGAPPFRSPAPRRDALGRSFRPSTGQRPRRDALVPGQSVTRTRSSSSPASRAARSPPRARGRS